MDPKQEIFDVVDATDCIVGQRSRAEIHLRNLRHRAVHIFIFNAREQLFLQKRSWNKDTAPGRWSSSCAGHVDAGESYDQAAVRELAEELGIAGAHPEKLLKLEACPETGSEFVWLYRLQYNGEPLQLNPDEISCGQWLSSEDIEKQIITSPNLFAPSFIYVWRRFRQSRT